MFDNSKIVVSEDGTKLWACSAGDTSKPTVVFIPGLSCIAQVYEKQWADPELLQNLHLITYDVRGQGQSDQPLEAEAYVSARIAEDFKAVCDAFGVDKPFVAGWSVGAATAADIVALYGAHYISGVILLSGVPYRGMSPETIHPGWAAFRAPYKSTDLAVWHLAVKSFVESCLAHPEIMPIQTKYAWIGGATIQHPAIRDHYLSRTQDEKELLRSNLPLLALLGADDIHADGPKLGDIVRERFPGSEVHVLEDCGHSPFYEKAEDVNAIILKFVARVNPT